MNYKEIYIIQKLVNVTSSKRGISRDGEEGAGRKSSVLSTSLSPLSC